MIKTTTEPTYLCLVQQRPRVFVLVTGDSITGLLRVALLVVGLSGTGGAVCFALEHIGTLKDH